MTRWCRRIDNLILRVGLLLMAGLAAIVIGYSDLPVFTRTGIACLLGTGSLICLGGFGGRRTLLGFLALCAVVLAWWLMTPPSNSRNWQPDVRVLPWAEIRGNQVTLHNIRNCDYRSESDYTVRHYDKTFDLSRLKSVDLFLVHWGAPYIAHTMLSFGFQGEGNVCFSIEVRRQVGEEFSLLKGFFRQNEVIYVVGDERDLVGLRANHRGEQVYLYRLKTSEDFVRNVFLDYLRKVNDLRESEDSWTPPRGSWLPHYY
jgi:hypothetical protein